MKKITFFILCCFILSLGHLLAQEAETQMFTSNGTFTVPAGVTEIVVQAWGAGGAGGTAAYERSAGGGGGGGGYAKSTLTVKPGDIIYVTVGKGGANNQGSSRDGGASGVSKTNQGTLVVRAAGGKAGTNSTLYNKDPVGGNGGGVDNNNNNVGNVVTQKGGNGGKGYETSSVYSSAQHGGGGAAGIFKIGSTGSGSFAGGNGGAVSDRKTAYQQTSGTGHAFNNSATGNGANGGYTYRSSIESKKTDATAASSFGGGGGGASRESTGTRGLFSNPSNGADGAVLITYVPMICDVNPGVILYGEWSCSESDTTIKAIGVDGLSPVSPEGGTFSWEKAPTVNGPWTVIKGANEKDYTINVKELASYRRGYTVEGCDTKYSDTLTLTAELVADALIPGYVDYKGKHDVNFIGVCKNGAVDISLTPSIIKNTIQWQSSTDQDNWTDVTTDFREYNYKNSKFTETVYIRYYKGLSESCRIPSSNVFTVKVYELPVINSVTEPEDLCPGKKNYELVANVPEDAEYSFVWGQDADNTVDAATGKVRRDDPNCGMTYNYSVKAVDENNCESEEKTGSFTIETPTLTFSSMSTLKGVCKDGNFVIPSAEVIKDSVLSNYTGNCADGLSVVSITPAPGTTIAEATDVTVKVAHTCLEEPKELTLTVTVSKHNVELTAANSVTTLCAGNETTLTATVTPDDEGSFVWTKNSEVLESTDNPLAITADAVGVFNYGVSYTASTGCIYTDDIDITVFESPVVKDTVLETAICHELAMTPLAKANTTGEVLSGVTYSWEAPVVEGITGLSNGTNKSSVSDDIIDNENTATTEVVYTVTPKYGNCTGNNFTVTVNVKPNIAKHEFSTLNFKNTDIVLYYGACDTVYQYVEPEYVTPVTEYQGKLTITHSTLPVPLTLGEYEIVWTFTDPCGNTRTENQTVTVSFPPCGEGFYAEDADGNKYETVRIGCECWLAQNLKTTKYSDATKVPVALVYTNDQYPDKAANLAKFGRLYSWYSAVKVAEGDNETLPTVTTGVNDTYVQGVCPDGWGLPEEADYQNMMNILGNVAKVKTADESAWLPNAAGVAPETFNALGAGYYDKASNSFTGLLGEAYFWTSQKIISASAACMCVAHYCPRAIFTDEQNGKGFSVRCIRKEVPVAVR